MQIVIVGAGMAGVSCGAHVVGGGHDVVLLDKGRGVGGRMATRRIGAAVIDHGAQFATARHSVFAAAMDRLSLAGAARPWFRGHQPTPDEPAATSAPGLVHWRGRPGMTALPRGLADGLVVRTATRVEALAATRSGWTVHLVGGETLDADVVVATAPVPQTLELLDRGAVALPDDDRAILDTITYAPCLAVLAVLRAPSAVPPPGGLRLCGEPAAWLADNQVKGISSVPAVTVHAGPETSRAWWTEADETVVSGLLGAVAEWIGGVDRVAETQVHRWRYAMPERVHPERCVVSGGPAPLVVAGDAFAGPRVEGAFLSGRAAADAVAALA